MLGGPVFVSPTAASVPTDPLVTGLTSITVEGSLAELAGLGIQLKTHLLASSYILTAGTFALWVQYMEIADGATLELSSGSTLEIT